MKIYIFKKLFTEFEQEADLDLPTTQSLDPNPRVN
jgi:hypothetical protein